MARHMEKRPINNLLGWNKRLSTWVGGKWLSNGEILYRYYGPALCQIIKTPDEILMTVDGMEMAFRPDASVDELMTIAFIVLEPLTPFLSSVPEESQEENS